MTQEKNIFLPFLKSDESAEFSSSLMNLLKIFNLIKVQEISKMLTSRVVVLQFVHQRAATSHIFNCTRFSTFLVFSSTNFHFMCSYMKHRQPDNISLNSENQPLSLIYYCSQSAYWLIDFNICHQFNHWCTSSFCTSSASAPGGSKFMQDSDRSRDPSDRSVVFITLRRWGETDLLDRALQTASSDF